LAVISPEKKNQYIINPKVVIMIFDEISFHDSQILRVLENPKEQILEFIIDFPTNWEENTFEHKVLKFEGVIFYNVEEIPFSGLPTILNIVNLGEIEKDFSSGQNEWKTLRNRIKIETNSGNRIVEFSECTLLEINNQ
jgi:hypothetical protein